MSLSAPTKAVFFISVVLAVLGLLSGFGVISAIPGNSFYIMTAAWAVLTGGVMLKGI